MELQAEIPAISHTIGKDGRKQISVRTRTASTAVENDTNPVTEQVFFPPKISEFISPKPTETVSASPIQEIDPVLTQIRIAFANGNYLAIGFGLALGGFVPLAAWSMIHLEIMESWHAFLILGASIFSALTVVEWGTIVFRKRAKAIGFAVLVEGVMLASQITWLSIFALCLLVVINAVNSAVNLVRDTLQGS